MRVLITRPEREATALASALAARGHVPVIAPLFQLDILHPPNDFAASLSACQAILLTSANGARALAEASAQRSKPILAVGDTTAATAEGLGFTAVTSASGDGAALASLVRERLDPAAGALLHVSGIDVGGDLGGDLALEGFSVERVPLYEARAVTTLPESARAALEARAIDVATFFSPRAAELFARLVDEAGLAPACRAVTALAISPAAAQPLAALPFKTVLAAPRPSRQAVLDEIDRLAKAGVQPDVPARSIMSDTQTSPPAETPPPPHWSDPPPSAPVTPARGGIGLVGAFVVGVIASVIVLAAALLSLPYWPDEARTLWRGPVATATPAPSPAVPAVDAAAEIATARQQLSTRLDDVDKRLRAIANTTAQAPAVSDDALAGLRSRIAALESKPAAPSAGDADKDIGALRIDIATLRSGLQSLEQAVSSQKDQARALSDAIDKANAASTQMGADEQKALAAARASSAIGIAARLSAALDQGRPFPTDVALLAPLAQDDKQIADLVAALQPLAQTGVAARDTLASDFPAVAKAAMADDLADDSIGQRVLGKLKALVSLRRVGADVPGDTVEAKLARAEAALKLGDLAKAAELVKSLPPQTARATSAWLARAEAHLAAQKAIDQLAAHAVTLLGAARQP